MQYCTAWYGIIKTTQKQTTYKSDTTKGLEETYDTIK